MTKKIIILLVLIGSLCNSAAQATLMPNGRCAFYLENKFEGVHAVVSKLKYPVLISSMGIIDFDNSTMFVIHTSVKNYGNHNATNVESSGINFIDVVPGAVDGHYILETKKGTKYNLILSGAGVKYLITEAPTSVSNDLLHRGFCEML